VSGTSTSGITNFVFSFIKELPVVGLNEDWKVFDTLPPCSLKHSESEHIALGVFW
jgi:hypothetical protein